MSILSTSPYDLLFDTLILVRISATNSAGTSIWSSENTSGARVRAAPDKMETPFKGLAISETALQISWTEATSAVATGNSAILNYRLYWDSGTSANPDIVLYEGSLTSYTQTGLVAG